MIYNFRKSQEVYYCVMRIFCNNCLKNQNTIFKCVFLGKLLPNEQCYNVKITAHGSHVSCIIIYVQILVLEVEPNFVLYVRIFWFMCHLSHSPIQ